MHRKSSVFTAACLFVALGLQAHAAWSQQEEDAFRLDPLIVTATRSAERLSQTTRSVTVVSAEDITAQGARTVVDALRSVPGLDIRRTGAVGGTTSLFTRGAESDHTLVLIDGVKMNLTGGANEIAHLSVDNIERIEVVRGPASTLYGSTAVGGVVHIITKRGGGPLGASLSAGGGSFNTHSQRASLNVGTTWGGLSVSASQLDTDGHLAFNNQYDNASLSLRADLSPDEDTNLDLTLRYTDSEYHFPTDGTGALTRRHQFSTRRETVLGLRAARALRPWWNSSLQLGYHKGKSRYFPDTYPESPANAYAAEAHVGVDWQSVLAFDVADLTLGASYEEDEDTENDLRRQNTAGYGQLRLKLLEPLVLIGGLRADGHSEFGTELTYQISAAYFMAAGTKLRAALGTGFKEPTLSQTDGNSDLEPERSVTWELGIEQRLWEDRLRLEGVFFSNDFQDWIECTYGPAPDFLPSCDNIQEAAAHGVELSAMVTLPSYWTLGASYTWLHTEVVDAGGVESQSFVEGEALLRRAEHKVRLFGHYVRGRFSARLDLYHIGDRVDFDWPERADSPAYTKVDVALAYTILQSERQTLELFGRVENLFDEDYEEAYGFASPGFAAFGGIRLTL